MINTQDNSVLTHSFMAAILYASISRLAGIRTPHKGHKRPQSNVVFLYPPKTQFYSVMVGCIRQPLKRLAGSFAGTANLIQSATQCFAALHGGLSLFKGIPQ